MVCWVAIMIPVYFVQIAFQLTELFQIEIDAVKYTDQFTCYNKKRPSKGWAGVYFLHDNASSHKCEVVKSFLTSEKMKVLNHPPYSPDLSPCGFFFFFFCFQGLRKCFLEISIRLEFLLAALYLSVSPTDTKRRLFICFSRLGKRLQKYVSVKGEYFEGL